MNDEKIILAAEVCAGIHGKSCAPCPYYIDFNNSKCKQMKRDTLDLLHRQRAEIDRLQGEVGYWEAETKEARADIDQAAAEAIKEVVEIMKPWYKLLCIDEGDWCHQLDALAYNLTKEMAGDSDA